MSFAFGQRSLERMKGLHPDIVKVMKKAICCSPIDFTVVEGMRTLATQKKYLATGATRTLNSRHLTGHAIDIAPVIDGKISWAWPLYHQLALVIDKVAAEENVKLNWGGRWRSFKDGPHWELDWKAYPLGSKK